jgi:hypothetical protein
MVLKGVKGIFGFGSSQDDHRGIGKTVEQLETVGTGHFNIQEEKVHSFPVEVFKGVHHIEEMPFDFNEFTFFAEFAEEIRGDLDVFYYDARNFHVQNPNKRTRTGQRPVRKLILISIEEPKSGVFLFYDVLSPFFSLNEKDIVHT